MLTQWGIRSKVPSRRSFLQAGSFSLLSQGIGGLSLVDCLQAEANAQGNSARPKSIIYVVLAGGPSHLDMWDPKPEAPVEYRGPFRPIQTSLSGCELSELMPNQAKLMDQVTLIRGIRSVENDHYLSEVYSGLPRGAGKRPAFGSVFSKLGKTRGPMPPYVSLADYSGDDRFEFEKPHYLGVANAPFKPSGETIQDLTPVGDLGRLGDRRSLLKAFDGIQRQADGIEGLDRFQAQALDMITSPAVREAFDVTKEPEETLVRYGKGRGKFTHQTVKSIVYNWDPRPFVQARRLVEAGVRIVTVQVGAWDHHSGPEADVFYSLGMIVPALDITLHALFTDLKERGLSEDVLVVVLGEFGRTPKISYPGPGREHWADAGCALFFGGGLKMGQVIGATDSRGELAIHRQTSFQNIMSSIYRYMGIDLDIKIPDFNGRPQHLLEERKPIDELF